MFLKFHFEKNGVQNTEHWVEPGEDFRPNDMYGGWRHITYTYDEATSKVFMYSSGNQMALPENLTNRFATGDITSGTPLGPLAFKDATKFVIGGYQNHIGNPPYNGLETWMLTYTGKLDEFRIYNRALTAQEVSALYTLERQSR